MEKEPTYVFRFGIRGRTVEEDHITRREAPLSELLDCFDAAHDWVMENPEKRYAEVFGPGMKTRVVEWTTREFILTRLPDTMPKHRTIIGLAWMDLSGRDIDRDYRLYKVWVATVRLPDLPDRPETHYGFLEVDPEDWDKGLEWAHANRWHDYGVWVAGKPALVFGPDYEALSAAFSRMVEILPHLPTRKLERAPVRYDWASNDSAYPRMAPTRSRGSIQKLRSRFPTAGENLLYAPLEILLFQYGYGRAR